MRRFVPVLLVVGLLSVGGCRSTSTVDTAAPTNTTATVTATPTPSPTPTVDRKAEWEPILDRAQLTMAEAGTPTTAEYGSVFGLPCGKSFTPSRWADRAWTHPAAKGGFISYAVAAYEPEPGPAIATDIRASLTACTTWMSSDNQLELRDARELTVKQPSGVDPVFSYCYRMNYVDGSMAGRHIFVCEAFVARGHMLAVIGSYAETLPPVQVRVKTLVGLAAGALTRALPTV